MTENEKIELAVHREVAGLGRWEILQLLVKARVQLKSADKALEVAAARIQDHENSAYDTLSPVLSSASASLERSPAHYQDIATVRWRTPELILLLERWGRLEHPQNIAELIELTGKRWGTQLAEGIFKLVYKAQAA